MPLTIDVVQASDDWSTMVKQLKPPLRAVKPSERAPQRKKALTVVQAAARGTHEELLTALRLRLAAAMEDPIAHPRDLAALSRQVVEISKELHATTRGTEDDPVGEAAATADERWSPV
jgi:hypothetical protein